MVQDFPPAIMNYRILRWVPLAAFMMVPKRDFNTSDKEYNSQHMTSLWHRKNSANKENEDRNMEKHT